LEPSSQVSSPHKSPSPHIGVQVEPENGFPPEQVQPIFGPIHDV